MKQNVKRDIKANFNEVVRKLMEDNVDTVAEAMGVDNVAMFEISKGTIAEMEINDEIVYINVDAVVKADNFDLEDALMEFEDRKKREAEKAAKKAEKLKKLKEKAEKEAQLKADKEAKAE